MSALPATVTIRSITGLLPEEVKYPQGGERSLITVITVLLEI